ncbi:hypothetical protein [Frateuria sp.]|uniref:hypothetical protein n=1 Tax=Frateuria sp. TaxID=2211372 RepID=UPI002D80EE8B|nr:hypothetical protein [Frateuria sp.]
MDRIPASSSGRFVAGQCRNAASQSRNHVSQWQNPDSFLNKLWLDVVASALMGAAFVYVGARIAPASRKPVGYVLTVTIILIAGFLAFPAVTQHDWWALIGCVAMASGGAVVAHSAAIGELDFDTHRLT